MNVKLAVSTITGLVALFGAAAVAADPPDHDRARAALVRGEVRPMSEILAAVAVAVPGDVVEVELERERGHWIYELKVITTDGRVLEVLVDAQTARLIEGGHD